MFRFFREEPFAELAPPPPLPHPAYLPQYLPKGALRHRLYAVNGLQREDLHLNRRAEVRQVQDLRHARLRDPEASGKLADPFDATRVQHPSKLMA